MTLSRSLCCFALLLAAGVFVPLPAPAQPSFQLAQSATGQVVTLAGSTEGYADGQGTAARFGLPTGIAVDRQGNVYVVDGANYRIRKLAPDGTVTTLAGGQWGQVDGQGEAAQFFSPGAIAVAGDGALIVTDANRLRRITPDGTVTTFVSDADALWLREPIALAIDKQDRIFVAERSRNRISVVTPDGKVAVFAGTAEEEAGDVDGVGTQARFKGPQGLAVDAAGNVYVAEGRGSRIRKITPAGMVTTLAGSGEWGYKNGAAKTAAFNMPQGLAVDAQGNLYIADTSNHCIRRYTPDGVVRIFAGTKLSGNQDGSRSAARFYEPHDLAFGPDGQLYVADTLNRRIRKLSTTP